MKNKPGFFRRTALGLLGITAFSTSLAPAHAQADLPLSGPAFVMADEAYKAYARGDYRQAADKAREALRQRPDVAELRSLLSKSEAASAGPAPVRRAEAGLPRPPSLAPAVPVSPVRINPVASLAFGAAEAAYQLYARGEHGAAAAQAREAVRLAPDNRDYRLLLIQALTAAGLLADADQAITDALALHTDDARLLDQRERLRGQQGQALAAAAYQAFDGGNFAQAADSARQAVALAPANPGYRALLVNALYRAARYPEAEEAANVALAADRRNAALLAQRGFIRQRMGLQGPARQDFEDALAAGSLPVATEIGLLVDLGRKPEARLRFDAARAGGQLGELPATQVAYLAARVGDDAQALVAFNRADASGQLVNTAYQDAAFAALRARDDAQAIGYFKRTIDDAQALKLRMEPQLLFNTRRAVAEVSRETGLIASLSYRGAVSGAGLTPSVGTDSLQGGIEGYWRPWGYQNGQYAEVFARAFQTLYSEVDGGAGSGTRQAAVGIRYKPLPTQNLVASFSRVFSPSGGRDDWLAQLGYSADMGTDLRVDVPSWWTTRASAEWGRYLSAGQSYALAEVQAGKSFRAGDSQGRWVIFPHLSVAAQYDSTAAQRTGVGIGPGITARYWFREDAYAAPRSYVDLSLQYRTRLSGSERIEGVSVTTTLSH